MIRFCCIAILAALALIWAAPTSAGEKLRIVTFNPEILAAPGTHYSRLERFRWDFARRQHFERIAAIIESLDPDILNLVECTSVEAVDYLIQILHEKGMTDYKGYHVESNDKFTSMDVAVITKFEPTTIDGQPIRIMASPAGDMTWRENFTYVDERSGKQRSQTAGLDRHGVYLIEAKGQKLGFLGVHFKSNPEDGYSNARRTAESLIAQRIIQKEIVDRGFTPIVLGDLNDYDPDVPDRDDTRAAATKVIANLKDYDPAAPGPEMVNAASKIARVADRYSSVWDRNENGAEDPDDVRTMIDHILLHKSLMPHVRRAFISHASDITASDHFPIVVDLELSK